PEEGLLRIDVDVTAPGGRRRVPLAGTVDGAAQLPRRVRLTDGRMAVVRWRGESLGVAVYPPRPTVTAAEVPRPDLISVSFDSVIEGGEVVARRRDDYEEVRVPMAAQVQLDLSAMPSLETLTQTEFDVLLLAPGDEEGQPAVMGPDVGETLTTHRDREFYCRAGI